MKHGTTSCRNTIGSQGRNIYIALEDLDVIWDEDDIPGIVRLWNEGFSLMDIANACERESAEVFLLLMDLDIKGNRDQAVFSAQSGAYGRRKGE
ncbi:hypothetical protein [Polycladomyces subterraneus]|uniref:Helix-turn-helix domain containing protein n=1 Tax=Polycladomyces subterraneus TaxID=1016997 RepID=A0ABT8IK75_9BACL|nr:hypothetical protein [Polycladomyces subterraneus]MDN4593193.1 hypothetical protein [Polycladomyces subterraneus]